MLPCRISILRASSMTRSWCPISQFILELRSWAKLYQIANGNHVILPGSLV